MRLAVGGDHAGVRLMAILVDSLRTSVGGARRELRRQMAVMGSCGELIGQAIDERDRVRWSPSPVAKEDR